MGKKLKAEIAQGLGEVLKDEPSAIPPTFLQPSRFTRVVEDPVTSELRMIRGTLTALLKSDQEPGSTALALSDDERKELSAAVHSLSQHHWESARRYAPDVFPYAAHLVNKRV